MRALIAVAVVLVLGLVGIVFMHERDRGSSSVPGAKIETISTGDTVDLDSHVQRGVFTVVEFTADW